MNDLVAPAPLLAHRLVEGLSSFRGGAVSGVAPHAAGLFSYCALTRERLKSIRAPKPILGVVLSGAKEVFAGVETERLPTGTLFVLPADVDLDIVNEPDERSGLYQSLILEIDPDTTPDLGPLEAAEGACTRSCAVPLTAALVDATVHAARAIAEGPAGATVRKARLAELLALLHGVPEARPLFDMSISERVARLVRNGLDERWTASQAARRLAMSESTLRRRLAANGQSFSTILQRERMGVARQLMEQGARSGTAAFAVGYASRAHFARRFRATFGVNPARD